ncbi:MAG: phosphodiester glycosidase family protein [Patescibacteria group bacterium]
MIKMFLGKILLKISNMRQHMLLFTAVFLIAVAFLGYQIKTLSDQKDQIRRQMESVSKELAVLKDEDQYKRNEKLEGEINKIEKTYEESLSLYEQIIDLSDQKKNTNELEKLFAQNLNYLSQKNYASAEAVLSDLSKKIAAENAKTLPGGTPTANTANVTVSNTPPGSGYSRQNVKTDFGTFLVDIVTADLNTTRVIVDAASEGDCSNECPVLSLGDYVGRNGAFAGVNGSYFCPAEYPTCAGKTNSFDTLLMNKNKVYFNSSNNVYSNVPAVIFSGTSARYVGRSSEWGRDTGVDAVLANQPLLVSGGNVVFGGDDEVKRIGAGSRSFVGSSGTTIYIGVVHGVNAAQMARVLHAMGIQNALNLDSGGSIALWSGGYKVGPGRSIPNALLLIRK